MLTRRTALASLFSLPLAPATLGESALTWQTRLIQAARKQIGVTRSYDPAYVRLDYPGGDVPRDRGVCTDVVIRAYRDAFNVDLQTEVHKDMAAHFGAYPNIWDLRRTDRNIDHRRVPNLETFFKRQGAELPASNWQPGDLVTSRIDGRLPHIGIVSDRKARSGRYKVIHNIGSGTQEEDILGKFDNERRFCWMAQTG